MRKILLAVAVFASILASAQAAYAQTAVPSQSTAVPQVSVSSLKLQKADYNPGATAYGTVTFQNKASVPVSGIYYQISLRGSYANGLAGKIYDSAMMVGPISLGASEQKSVDFSYLLRDAFTGSLGLQVRAYSQGMITLGWKDAFITVSGTSTLPSIENPSIVADGVSYGLEQGPTAKKSLFLEASISPSGTVSADLTPRISIYDRAEIGSPKASFDGSKIHLAQGKPVKMQVPLPTFGFSAPGVYVGHAEFVDSEGNIGAQSLDFRYIIAGDTATLYSLATDAKSLKTNDPFSVTVGYAGTPYDISNGGAATTSGINLKLDVHNEQGKPVASYNQPFDINDGTSKDISLHALIDANALRAEASFVKDGRTLSAFSVILSDNYASAGKDAEAQDLHVKIFLGILALVLILAVIHFSPWGKTAKKPIKVLVLLLACTSLFLGGYSLVQARAANLRHRLNAYSANFSVTDSGNDFSHCKGCPHFNYIPNVAVNDPVVNDDGSVTISGTADAIACGNKDQILVYTLTYEGDTYTTDPTKNHHTTAHHLVVGQGDFSFVLDTPPDAGAHTFSLEVENIVMNDTKNFINVDETSWRDARRYRRGYVVGDVNFETTPGGVEPTGSATGNIDLANCSVVAGWACDPTGTNNPISISFYDAAQGDNPIDSDSVTADQQAGTAVDGNGNTDAGQIAAVCAGTSSHRYSLDISGAGLNDGQPHSIYALDDNSGQAAGAPVAINLSDPTCVPVPEQCTGGHVLDPSIPNPVAPDDCVCPAGTADDAFGNCAPFPDQCTNLTALGASGPDGGGPYQFVPGGYYQDDGTTQCYAQINCDLAAAGCDLSQCDAPDGYRHLDTNTCSFPSYCTTASIAADQASIADSNGVISCDDPEGEDVFPSDIDFSGLKHATGVCTLSWKIADSHNDVPPISCKITSDNPDFVPVTSTGLNGTSDISLPKSGAKYQISCGKPGQLRPAIKIAQCLVDKSPNQQEI